MWVGKKKTILTFLTGSEDGWGNGTMLISGQASYTWDKITSYL